MASVIRNQPQLSGDVKGFATIVNGQHRKDEAHFNGWPNAAGFNALGDTPTPIELQVSGKFPDYVAGSLIRTGPGGYKVPRTDPKTGEMACSHWFDGFMTTHKFQIAPADGDGNMRVMYSSRGSVDKMIEHARKTGKLEGVSFGQKRDPCDTFYRKMKTTFEATLPLVADMTSIGVVPRPTLPAEAANVGKHPGRVLTLTSDATVTKQIDLDTLEPLKISTQSHLHPFLTGPLSGAHAAVDPETGDLYNYNIAFGPVVIYRVFHANARTGKVKILAQMPGLRGAYIHSMLITENFVILCVWPAFIGMNGISILWNRSILESIKFDPTAKATWYVIDRRGGRGLVKRFTSPAFFCFHTTNAWEEPRSDGTVDITCELVEFKNMDILNKFYYENLVSDQPGASTGGPTMDSYLARYKLPGVPLKSWGNKIALPVPSVATTPAERILHLRAGDLPTINPRFACKPHRFVWTMLARGRSSFVDGLGKIDTQTQTTVAWEQTGHTPSEPLFVRDPNGQHEDDGVVLTIVLDGYAGTSYLLCLDARDMTEIARADVRLPVGFGFHSLHLAEGQ